MSHPRLTERGYPPNGLARFHSKEAGTQGPKLLITTSSTATVAPTPTTTITTPAPSTTPSSRESQVLSLVNAERQKAGCSAVQIDARLTKSASAHSADMVQRNFFAHVNPDSVAPNERMVTAGFPVRSWGENIAAGQADATSVMHAWMNSSGHRANILNCGFRYLGMGVAEGGSYRIYWTQNFAS